MFLKNKAKELNAEIDPGYRYVIVDAFLTYVAFEHLEEINFMLTQIKDGDIEEAKVLRMDHS